MDSGVKEFIDQVDNSVRSHFAEAPEIPSEEEVKAFYEQVYGAFLLVSNYAAAEELNREEVIDNLVKHYCTELSVVKKFGFAYKDEETRPWLGKVEDDIDWFYWNRYKSYLLRKKKWAPAAVRSIEGDTRAILDLMANPRSDVPFERRGLVVASVQSGKTANYTGLICRAADVGYKIIIVMAGVYNVLRNQTQARLEDGFTGFNIVDQMKVKPVGVGLGKSSRRPIACTSREADFNKARASALRGIQTAHTNEPWLFVVKKNSKSLEQVYEWLKENASPEDQLLLIDDEADNASINGKYKRERREDEPSRINGQIRYILSYFNRYCYIGYTATPYANILIDPNIELDGYGLDLFPKSFIYTLEESSDYFGASKVFDDYDDIRPQHLRFIDDIDGIIPPKHKSSFEVEDLPESLKEAIRAFVLATTIRALRGAGEEHSSMMVNVSPYKFPQKTVSWRVEDYLKEINEAAKAFGHLDVELALKSSECIQMLYLTWIAEYRDLDKFTWREIQEALSDTTKTMHVVCVNSDSNDALNYENQVEHVIAVGGYRLSRGLTLEGLVISYYSRNAKAYDALMQMARWFGYRPGYEDLCRIWMSEKAAGWYKFVADSTEDLFDELRDMRQAHSTPRDYGLKIRQSPESLTVTARNKMGTAKRIKASIDLNNGFTETIAFDRNREVIDENTKASLNFIGEILPYKTGGITSLGVFFRGVPVEKIVSFIDAYKNSDSYSPKSEKKPVLNYIENRKADGELKEWDVLIAHGHKNDFDGGSVEIPGIGKIYRERRYPGQDTGPDALVVGEKNRLASRGVEKAGLCKLKIDEAEEEFRRDHPEMTKSGKDKSCSDKYYRRKRTFPLLVLHPVTMSFDDAWLKRHEATKDSLTSTLPYGYTDFNHHEEAFGWSISFPYTSKRTKLVDYIYNEVAVKKISEEFEKEDTDDDIEDD